MDKIPNFINLLTPAQKVYHIKELSQGCQGLWLQAFINMQKKRAQRNKIKNTILKAYERKELRK